MKLELKHLAIAFTNNWKVTYFDDERELNQVCNIVELREDECTISNGEYEYDVKFDDIKLLCFPLSALTKEITINGEEFYPLEILGQLIDEDYKYLSDDEYGCIIGKDETWGFSHIDADGVINSYNLFYSEKKMGFFSTIYKDGNPDDIIDEIEHSSFELFQKLFEWKFDVFGLIDAGLAEQVTEDFNPYK